MKQHGNLFFNKPLGVLQKRTEGNNFNNISLLSYQKIQCVSVDSTSFVIYPEIKAREVKF